MRKQTIVASTDWRCISGPLPRALLLFQATTVVGFRGRRVEAIPIGRVIEICKRHGVVRSTR